MHSRMRGVNAAKSRATGPYMSESGLTALVAESASRQRAQMHASRCIAAGTRASSDGENVAFTHQQFEGGTAQVMAHALGPPHSGQRLGSMELSVDAEVMSCVTQGQSPSAVRTGRAITNQTRRPDRVL